MNQFHGQDIFIEETEELLHLMELALMRLETNAAGREDIDQVFRALHTIKGSSAMFGYDLLSDFVHDLENRFDAVRSGDIRVDEDLIAELLSSSDAIKTMLANPQTPSPRASHSGSPARKNVADSRVCRTFRIRFVPHAGIFKRGVQIAPLFDELRELGSVEITADASIVPGIDKLEPESAYLAWTIELKTGAQMAAVQDVFIFVESDSYLKIEQLGPDRVCAETQVETGDQAPPKEPEDSPADQSAPAESPAGSANASSKDHPVRDVAARNLTTPDTLPPKSTASQNAVGDRSRGSVRVQSNKLDDLVNLVGELVTLQSRLSDEADRKGIPEFQGIAENLERLSSDLRDKSLSIRMVPLTDTFNGFKRPVHDIARELAKHIDFHVAGGDTEIDKNIADRLRDPLIHLIRNAVDHGIETPAQREAFGKSLRGRVDLSAERGGRNIVIKVRDDGRGLNRTAIYAKAVERGLIHSAKEIPDDELYAMIFEPGFSTAETTTSISGRGVGMDVVRSEIEALGGQVEISTESCRGTTFTLSIPLTMAIVDGFMVEVCGQKFVMNLALVRECLAAERLSDKSVLSLRGEIIPTIDLRRLFKRAGKTDRLEDAGVVIFQIGHERYGLVVDRIVGKHQTVIKKLSARENPTGLLEGASILGDGSIALILDLPRIVQRAKTHDNVSTLPRKPAQTHDLRRIG